MEKINKNNLLIIISIILFIICLFIQAYGRFSPFFFDTSREVYVPYAMNNGGVLYKDILNVYTPLGYQLNAFALKLFGENLRTFYFMGLMNSIIFIIGLYSLAKLYIKNNWLILSYLFFIITSCIFCVSQANYIFPYSYSLVYALSAIIWSLYFLIKHLKLKENKYLYLSFMLFGLSISFKYEFILLVFLMMILLFKRENKVRLLSIVSMTLFPLLSLGILLAQGCTISDILTAIKQIISLSNTESFKQCYRYLGIIPTTNSLKIIFLDFIKVFTLISISIYIFSNIYIWLKEKKALLSILTILLSVIIIYIFKPIFVTANASYFDWIGIFTIIVVALNIILHKKIKTDSAFIFLSISAVLISVKCLFVIDFSGYGTYYFPLLLLICIYTFCIFIPENYNIKHATIKAIEYSLTVVLAIFSCLYLFSNIEIRNYAFSAIINTDRGSIGIGKTQYWAVQNTLNYLKDNTNKNNSVLLLPEGAMVNFLTDRISDNNFYYLIPPNIEMYEERKIVKKLESNLPDYIILQPMPYSNFKKTYFCESFGENICNLISENYENISIFGNEFWLAIYKRKELNEN